MRKESLTRTAKNADGPLIHEYEVDGITLDVYDSARNTLLIIELFADESLTPDEKSELVFAMLFANPEQLRNVDPRRALSCVLWDACGLDVTGAHVDEYERPVMDWEQDAGRIRASLLMAYGMNWDEVSRTFTFAGVCDLLSMLLESGDETPFQQAIMYRTAKAPKPTKYNQDEVKAFRARRDHYRLRNKEESAEAIKAREDNANRQLTAILTDLFANK